MTETTLAKRIRLKAKREGIGVDELRRRLGLGGSTFWDLLNGKPPKTRNVILKLREGGIEVPHDAVVS